MSEVKPGGVEIAVNVNDLSQEGINSAKQNLKSLEKTAEGTAEKLAPLKDELSSKLDTMNGLNGLVAMQGGFNSLFSSATRAGTALKKTRKSIEDLSAETKSGLGDVLNFVGGLTSVLQTQFSITNKLAENCKNFKNLIGYLNSGTDEFTNQAESIKSNAAATLKNKERLIELVKTRKKSAEQIKESVNLVNQMNSTYKGLNLTIDATNGKIGNIKNLKNRIDAEHALTVAQADREKRVAQLNAIAGRFGIQNASAIDRQAAATLLLSNAEAGATLKRKILSAETYKGIAANIQSVFWKKSATAATQKQSLTNTICAATNVALGVTAKGASTAFLALKASMATNPLGWILLAVEGVTLLGAGIYKWVKSLWEVPSAAQKAAESMERLNETSAKNFDSHQRLLDRLVQFNAQGGAKTVDDKKEAQAAIDTLNAYHGLGLTLDELTGKVNINSKALEQHRERLRDDRRFAIAGTIRANEDVLEEKYKELAKLKGRGGEYEAATGEQKIKIRLELDMLDTKEGEEISKIKEKLENLYKERQKLLDESDAKAKAQREAFRKRSREVTDKGEDFIDAEQRELRRQSLTEEAREIEAVKTAYKKLRDPLRDVMLEKSKAGQNNIYELGLLQRIDELEQKRIAHIRNQYAEKARAAEKEKEEKEAEKDRALIEKLTEDRDAKNRTALENEIHQFQKSIEERKKRLQALVEEGKATDEQKKTLEQILQLEKDRINQIKQQHLEQLKARFNSFNENQTARERRFVEAAEDRKTRKDIERNPFKAGLNLKAQREEIEAKIEEAKRKVEQAHAFALKQGDLTDKQKAIVEQREKNLLDLQQQQDRLQGLMGEAENEARNRVASLLQQYASEKTPSVLDTKFKGTVEAYKAEIENQQRGQMDGKDVKLENIKTILERDEQRKQQNEQKIIDIGRQIVANLQGV